MAAATSSSITSMRDFWKDFDLVSLQVMCFFKIII